MSFPITFTGRINFPAAVDQPVGKRLLQAIVDDLAVAKSNKVVKSYTGKGHGIDFTFEPLSVRLLSYLAFYPALCGYSSSYRKFIFSTGNLSSASITVSDGPNGIIVTYTVGFLEQFKWAMFLFWGSLLFLAPAVAWERRPEILLAGVGVIALFMLGIYYFAGAVISFWAFRGYLKKHLKQIGKKSV